LFSEHPSSLKFNEATQLRFLSVITISQIPLCLAVGPSFRVWTEDEHTLNWFSDNLVQEPETIPHGESSSTWLEQTKLSYCGILAEVTNPAVASTDLSATELVFYGQLTQTSPIADPTIEVYALPLSSKILQQIPELTPPSSPVQGETIAQFLPDDGYSLPEPVSASTNSVSDLFDRANELRRKANGKGGASIAAAAAGVSRVNRLVGFKKPKSEAGKASGLALDTQIKTAESIPSAKRILARSPSLGPEGRPHSRKGSIDPAKRSSLSRVTSFATVEDDEQASIEDRNKAAISRLVMAGMRLHGLQPRKKSDRPLDSPLLADHIGSRNIQDDDYKLVYHQTYKAAVFVFVCLVCHKAPA
jgi:hypothetical protein